MHIKKLTVFEVDGLEFRSINALTEHLESKVHNFVGGKIGKVMPLHPSNFIEIMDMLLDNRAEIIALLNYEIPTED